MADDAPTENQSADTQPEPGLTDQGIPERLRVHSLARLLGTTSKQVLDALAELDGRQRSAHSTVDKIEAEQVRATLSTDSETAVTVTAAATVVDVAEPDDESSDDEPDSRLLVETTTQSVERADYLPLFVAPEPVEFRPRRDSGNSDDSDASDDSDDSEGPGDTGDSDDNATDSDDDQRPSSRRRRRGRRGRGRGRGEQGGDDSSEDGSTDLDEEQADGGRKDSGTDSAEDNDDDDDESAGEGGNRRRRRRRRRKSGSGDDNSNSSNNGNTGNAGNNDSSDDPPNTVVHERAPRSGKDDGEIQGISGSTRLEAKRQRRRDGRDSGRRRPPILSEAEFLARRESVDRVMVVRDKVRTEPPHEGARYTQIAVLEDGVVVEHFVTSAASASLVGNIYLGIVQNVLPSMEAAFVDIGRGRNGVLYAGEVNWDAAGLGGQNRKIEQALKPGDYVIVQVSKDPVGHKGARLTTQVSLAGRYLVYVPGASSTGISRKLPDNERQRLKEILREVVPAEAGVIIRTASEGVKEEDIRADVNRLQQRWDEIETKAGEVKEKAAGAAVALYEEPDVLVKVIRDLFNEDFSGLIVSGDEAWNTINKYVNTVAPDLVQRLTKYEPAQVSGAVTAPDVFAVHRIDEQLTKATDRKVWLPSGGSLVIDRTEAMTVIDVNTGKFTGSGGNLEQTVTRNNLEAAEEIVRQLRLRDIGGIIVVDFIDMVLESNRDLVLRRMTEALARDRTRHQVSEVTSLGLVQLTRKRLGTGLIEAFSTQCPHCAGRGLVLHGDPVDSAPTGGRRSESSGRRGKRGKRNKTEDVQVAKVPAHTPGEHPMFKAMAAANGRTEDGESEDEGSGAESSGAESTEDEAGKTSEERAEDATQRSEAQAAEETVDDEAFDESDTEDTDDTDDTDEDDDTDDTEDDTGYDDEDEIDLDTDSDDTDDDDDSDEDDDSDDDTDDEIDVINGDDSDKAPSASSHGVRHRRRSAARPAGPPAHEL